MYKNGKSTNFFIVFNSKLNQKTEECFEIMRNDIAIVKVRFASDKYTKTVMDKRFTFDDKLSSFGMKLFFIYYQY